MKELITTTEQEKNMGMFTHLGTFLGYFFPFANLFVPLIIWQSHRRSEFLNHHGKSVLNFQISLILYHLFAIGIFLLFFLKNILTLIGVDTMGRLFVSNMQEDFITSTNILAVFVLASIFFILHGFYIITTIIGGIKASKGELYTYPLSIRFIR